MAGYAVTISAVDNLSKTLNRINQNANRTLAPFRKLGGAVTRLMRTTGVSRLTRALGNLGNSARDAFQRLSSVIAPLGAISGAATLGGMYRMVAAWSNWGTELGNVSRNMGITAQALGNLQGAAQMAGTSGEALTNGLGALGQNLYDAVGGRNASAVVMMNTLGVAFRKNATQARNVTDVLPELADKIASLKDPYAQAQAASTLFGGSAAAMLPFLRRGAAGIREYQQAAERYLHITPQTAQAANTFREAQTRLTLAVEGLGNRISERLAPILGPLLTQFADWIATNPKVTAGINALGDGVQRFADWLRGIDWDSVSQKMQQWGDRIAFLTQILGGPADAIRDLMLLMGARFVAGVVGPLATVGVAVARLGATFAPLLMTPVGLAVAGCVAAVGALGLAAYELWKHWSGVEKLFSGMWSGIKDTFSAAWGYISPALDRMENALDSAGGTSGMRASGPASGGSLPSAQTTQRTSEAMRYFVSQGWTPAQAAGIVANLRRESGLNERAVGDGGRAAGLAQWHPDRLADIERHFGTSIGRMSYAQQLQAVNYELRQGAERAAGQSLAMQDTGREAGAATSLYYERPGDRAGEAYRRGALAQSIQADFMRSQGAAGAPMQVASISTGSTGTASSGSTTMAGSRAQDTVHRVEVSAAPGTRAKVTDPSGATRVVRSNVTRTVP